MSRPLRNQWYYPQSKLWIQRNRGGEPTFSRPATCPDVAESEAGSGREDGLNISVPSLSYLQRRNITLKKEYR